MKWVKISKFQNFKFMNTLVQQYIYGQNACRQSKFNKSTYDKFGFTHDEFFFLIYNGEPLSPLVELVELPIGDLPLKGSLKLAWTSRPLFESLHLCQNCFSCFQCSIFRICLSVRHFVYLVSVLSYLHSKSVWTFLRTFYIFSFVSFIQCQSFWSNFCCFVFVLSII